MNNNPLASQKCIPCNKSTPKLKGAALMEMQKQISGWRIVEEHHLEKEFHFPNFREALAFTNQIGQIAETEGHHPDIYLSYGKVKVLIWTHKIDGLSENDFVLAAKYDVLSS